MKIVEQRQTSLDFQEDEFVIETTPPLKKYGKLIVLYQSQKRLVTIGPHYYCFLPALVCFITAAAFLTYFVNQIFTSWIFQTFNAAFSVVWIASYIVVAFSDPGIAQPNEGNSVASPDELREVCNKCGASKGKRIRHCSYCDVCINGYDHHCPWVSKCIGQQNKEYFNFFVGITPLYIMYYFIVICICLARAA